MAHGARSFNQAVGDHLQSWRPATGLLPAHEPRRLQTAGDKEEEVEEEVGSVVVVVGKFPADASGAVSTLERECWCVVDAIEAES